MKKNKLKSKPSYDLYVQLRVILEIYLLTRVNYYIYFKCYNWDAPILISKLSIKEAFILKSIYEYDYKVFKEILFLYWDLEYYLENEDNVKYVLKTDLDNLNSLKIIFNKEMKSYDEFLEFIKKRKAINLWGRLEKLDMLYTILKHDIYTKLDGLDTTFKDASYRSIYNKYKTNNDLVNPLIEAEVQSSDLLINLLYYDRTLEELYKE